MISPVDSLESSRAVLPSNLAGDVRYLPGFLKPAEALHYFEALRKEMNWTQGAVTLFGKRHPIPRLEAWHGDPGATYQYSGSQHDPAPWTGTLQLIRDRLKKTRDDFEFNSVLGNLYRDGNDAMGWHSDDEPELGENPCIASISLGASRDFLFKHRTRKDVETLKIRLEAGSLLIMEAATQENWKHSIPRRRGNNPPGERINLTFRKILMASR